MNPVHNKQEPVIENKNSLAYPSRTLDPPFTMVDRAREIEVAGNVLQSHVNAKLDIILKQIRKLQDEAKKILEQAEENMMLDRIKCNFEKKIGMIVHLYSKPDGEKFFSLLSPVEWDNPTYHHFSSYQIKSDQSFEKIDLK